LNQAKLGITIDDRPTTVYIDSHAHLEGPRYDADRNEVLARAKTDGIEAYLAIGNGEGPDTADCGINLAEQYNGQSQYPAIWASVGIHPHEASLANEKAYARLATWARHPRVIAWGEIGLDYFYDHSPEKSRRQFSSNKWGWQKRLSCPSSFIAVHPPAARTPGMTA
jgi:Tat protein secretion system quality control protein TatD with DNase activity